MRNVWGNDDQSLVQDSVIASGCISSLPLSELKQILPSAGLECYDLWHKLSDQLGWLELLEFCIQVSVIDACLYKHRMC